jgi:hypothetical protein
MNEVTSPGPLWTIAVILVVLWVVGIASASTFGGLIHLLLPLALMAYMGSAIQRQRADS